MNKNKFIFLAIIIVLALLIKLLTHFAYIIEYIYSRKIYKVITTILSKLTSILPISIAEILIVLSFIFIAFLIFKNYAHILILLKTNPLDFFMQTIFYLVSTCLIIYIIFMSIWGLNYYRLPLKSYNENYKPTQEDIEELATILIEEANYLKKEISKSEKIYSIEEINNYIYKNYEIVFNNYSFLDVRYSKPKPIISSKIFSMLQITGIYSPFTSEANFNKMIPNISLPFTIAHELSHQIGISYEDEANFLAYMACFESDDLYIKYSATFMALLYTLSALDKNEEYKKIVSKISPEVLKDIKDYYSFWSEYRNKPISKISSKVNDTYLKANNQKQGVKSYSEVVNLLAYYRLKYYTQSNRI